MNEQELLLKTNNEVNQIVNDLMIKIKHLLETDKTSPRRSEYFEDLQTVMGIFKAGKVYTLLRIGRTALCHC